jgi:hypothetical protein
METEPNILVRTDNEKRLHQRPITFYVPEAEAAELIAAAELSGRSLGSYIRSRLFAAPRAKPEAAPASDAMALARLQGQMDRVGADIHELLR